MSIINHYAFFIKRFSHFQKYLKIYQPNVTKIIKKTTKKLVKDIKVFLKKNKKKKRNNMVVKHIKIN